jgi:hypothetical protein
MLFIFNVENSMYEIMTEVYRFWINDVIVNWYIYFWWFCDWFLYIKPILQDVEVFPCQDNTYLNYLI